jgi:tRNA(Ile)-lysidine synthase
MKIKIPKGKYVVAVSGGVDSMVLLDLLSRKPGIELVVAHFNHGIRPDANKDEELAVTRSEQLNLPIEVGYGHLGAKCSEEHARKARYAFLQKISLLHNADKIITAHHQDDLIETALINTIRGTGRKGFVSISNNEKVLRPLARRFN